LPEGFEADPSHAPSWLQPDGEIAIAGNTGGKSMMIGVSGASSSDRRVLAEDFGVGAPRGKILDLAVTTDGLTVATAVAEPKENRLEILLRDTLSKGVARPAASFDGAFTWAQVKWLDATTLALAMRSDSATNDSVAATSSLDLITVAGPLVVKPLDQITCLLSPLSFSPNARLAIAQGDTKVPPELLDLHAETCTALTIQGSIRVLAWAPDASAFLYIAHDKSGVPGVFRYDLGNGSSTVVAIASGAAAYASDGTIVAAGNNALSWRRAADSSGKPIAVEIALIAPGHAMITVNELGVRTLPAMLANSSMVFSKDSDNGAIDLATPEAAGPRRQLIEYSYPARAAFVLASGPAAAPLALGWSPDGKLLAVVDSGVQPNRITVLAPPR
jgi:hypothetical protein